MNYIVLFMQIFICISCSSLNTFNEPILDSKSETGIQLLNANITRLLKNNQIKSKNIDSLKLFYLENVTFNPNDPDKIEMIGKPYEPDFRRNIVPNSMEYFALNTAFHVEKSIDFFDSLFHHKLDFASQSKYKNMELFLGNFVYASNPQKIVIFQVFDPTLIYHEVAHRALWLIEGQLKINLGQPKSYLHLGILEYFSATIGNNPKIMGKINSKPLIRDLESPVYFDQFVSVEDSIQKLKTAYKNAPENWHNQFCDGYLKMLKTIDQPIEDAHRASIKIAGPLWQIRKQIGSKISDQLVADAVLNLPQFNLNNLDQSKNTGNNTAYRWQDFLYSLIKTDELIANGKHKTIILSEFKKNKFPIEQIW